MARHTDTVCYQLRYAIRDVRTTSIHPRHFGTITRLAKVPAPEKFSVLFRERVA
jgi:hypothetical protein